MLGVNHLRAMALDSAGTASWDEHTIHVEADPGWVTFDYDGNVGNDNPNGVQQLLPGRGC